MNQVLESLLYTPEEGRLTLQAARYLLIRPDLLVEIQKALETEWPDEVAQLLTGAGRGDGVRLASRLKEVFAYSDAEVLSSMTYMLGESGWGVAVVEMLNPDNKELVVRVEGSPFAEVYGPSVKPVCHLLTGLFAGTALAVFEQDVDGQETQCVARGDNTCRFVVTARSF